jgi:hypothetical protein
MPQVLDGKCSRPSLSMPVLLERVWLVRLTGTTVYIAMQSALVSIINKIL